MPSEVCVRQYHIGAFEAETNIYRYVKYDLCLYQIRFCNFGF